MPHDNDSEDYYNISIGQSLPQLRNQLSIKKGNPEKQVIPK